MNALLALLALMLCINTSAPPATPTAELEIVVGDTVQTLIITPGEGITLGEVSAALPEETEDELVYEDYVLEMSGSLACPDGKRLELDLAAEGDMHFPVAFVVKDGVVSLLCRTSAPLPETRARLLRYQLADGELFDVIDYADDYAKLSDAPMLLDRQQVVAADGKFLFNEGRMIVEINPDNPYLRMMKIAYEEKITSAIPSLQSRPREGYAFFHAMSRQGMYDLLSVASVSDERYVVIHTNDGIRLAGYLVLTDTAVTLYGQQEKFIATIEGDFAGGYFSLK